MTPTEGSLSALDYTKAQHVSRIGGRKRLTAEQKKRSYSEPEKMNEVGISDGEPSPFSFQKKSLHFVFPEHTVADRRKIFEKEGKASSTASLSKPELKQLQQNALADYIERKTGKRPSSQDVGLLRERSHSSYLQAGGPDSQSLSSASSMNSLQDQNLYRRRESVERVGRTGRMSSTLPPGLMGCFDVSGDEQKKGHRDGLVTSRPKTDRCWDHRAKTELTKGTQTDPLGLRGQPCFGKQEQGFETPSSRKSGKSVSVEDLLDRCDNQQRKGCVPVHTRSRSSPTADKKHQVGANGIVFGKAGLSRPGKEGGYQGTDYCSVTAVTPLIAEVKCLLKCRPFIPFTSPGRWFKRLPVGCYCCSAFLLLGLLQGFQSCWHFSACADDNVLVAFLPLPTQLRCPSSPASITGEALGRFWWGVPCRWSHAGAATRLVSLP